MKDWNDKLSEEVKEQIENVEIDDRMYDTIEKEFDRVYHARQRKSRIRRWSLIAASCFTVCLAVFLSLYLSLGKEAPVYLFQDDSKQVETTYEESGELGIILPAQNTDALYLQKVLKVYEGNEICAVRLLYVNAVGNGKVDLYVSINRDFRYEMHEFFTALPLIESTAEKPLFSDGTYYYLYFNDCNYYALTRNISNSDMVDLLQSI